PPWANDRAVSGRTAICARARARGDRDVVGRSGRRMGGALWGGGGAVDVDRPGGPPGRVLPRDRDVLVPLSSLVQPARPGYDAETDPQPAHLRAHLSGPPSERRPV